ncbi:MAG: hypothetical protein KME21_32035 [Desmonostoc vinosum HA7617-LM4]|jgi:uncharacterized protein YcsI (UPF0317 family)|nr:hypothetical protein [Desmonostoc vinosum HA7617-LM4]
MSVNSANAVYDIKIEDLLQTKRLPDGDKIELRHDGKNGIDAQKIQINLIVTADDWWKGVLLFTRAGNNTYVPITEVQQENGKAFGFVTRDDLKHKDLVLSKAKGFSSHTNMYHIEDAEDFFTEGQSFTFIWTQA